MEHRSGSVVQNRRDRRRRVEEDSDAEEAEEEEGRGSGAEVAARPDERADRAEPNDDDDGSEWRECAFAFPCCFPLPP